MSDFLCGEAGALSVVLEQLRPPDKTLNKTLRAHVILKSALSPNLSVWFACKQPDQCHVSNACATTPCTVGRPVKPL